MPTLPIPTIPNPITSSPDLLADWIEAYSLARLKPVSRGSVGRVLAREAAGNESALDLAWIELRDRQERYENQWPLKFTDKQQVTLHVRGSGRTSAHLLAYFLCILSLESGIDLEGRDLFELVVANLILGLGAHRSCRVGFPVRSDWPFSFGFERRAPRRIRSALRVFARYCGEQFNRKPSPQKNDLKVDVVGWWEFGRRGGWLHCLGQCTTSNEWRTSGKLADVNVSKLRDYVSWSVEPVRFFAIPYSGDSVSSEWWREACQDGGLLLDRRRLIELHVKAPLEKTVRKLVLEYCMNAY